MSKILKKKVYVETVQQFTLEQLAGKISEIVDHDDVATFIALLEKSYESWEVTEDLIRHFKGLEIIYNSEFKEDEREVLTPKSLLKN
jgi:hypothetical protein